MTPNPYRIDGPAIVSFSGGRTSGFMLAKIVEAHGGALPDDVRAVFCNTGLEHEKTYEFVEQFSRRVAPVTWIEYEPRGVREVNFETASRNGEPFEALIRHANILPNPVMRKCTADLKLKALERFAPWPVFTNIVGLRADEPRRVAKLRGQAALPMAEAGHVLADVLAFWKAMPFDLELPSASFGNCCLCFLKSRAHLQNVMRAEPERADWWIRMEALGLSSKPEGARFRSDRPSYAAMLEIARTQGVMFDAGEEDALPCACTE